MQLRNRMTDDECFILLLLLLLLLLVVVVVVVVTETANSNNTDAWQHVNVVIRRIVTQQYYIAMIVALRLKCTVHGAL